MGSHPLIGTNTKKSVTIVYTKSPFERYRGYLIQMYNVRTEWIQLKNKIVLEELEQVSEFGKTLWKVSKQEQIM